MTSLKHLLGATDLSAPSLHAVDRGFLLARETGARYTVLHALAVDTFGEFRQLLGAKLPEVMRSIEAEVQEKLADVVADPARNRGVAAEMRVERGFALEVVPAYAQSTGVDLILLGAQGSGVLKQLLIGSTTSHLLRKSRCPVVVVKQPAQAPYGRVLISVDFSPASEAAIKTARTVAPAAHIVLLHVFDVPFEGKMRFAGVDEELIHRFCVEIREHAFKRLRSLATDAGLAVGDYTALVERGDAARAILAEEEKHGHDLIVLGKHGTHVTEEMLLGSVTKRVLSESRCDVLVVVDERSPMVEPITP